LFWTEEKIKGFFNKVDKRQIEDFDNVIRCLNNNPLGISYTTHDHDFLTMLNTLYFPNLKPCQKRPDAYATSGDTLLLLEHFEFDASKPTNKGSAQRQTSAQTDREITKILGKEDFAVVAEMVTKSGKCYVDNFTRQFHNHYSRIAGYISDMKTELSTYCSNTIVGFVIEDSTPLGSLYFDGKMKCVDLTFSKEFLGMFEKAQDLDFVIFAMTGNDNNKVLSFISRSTIEEHRKNQIEVSNIDKFLFENSFCASGFIEY
jgi:hypothetical protein